MAVLINALTLADAFLAEFMRIVEIASITPEAEEHKALLVCVGGRPCGGIDADCGDCKYHTEAEEHKALMIAMICLQNPPNPSSLHPYRRFVSFLRATGGLRSVTCKSRLLFFSSQKTQPTMRLLRVFCAVLSCTSMVAAWTSTNHWQTSLLTGYKTPTQTSISVFPTGSDSATSTTTSTSLFTSGGYTLLLTVYDLFYPPSAAVCTAGRAFTTCGPTPALSRTTGTSITTRYWAPVRIANPTSCTKTSFGYTTASTVALPSAWIDGVAQQATQSVEALLVTTYVKTLSTNMGGQAVTTTVCDVYLRTDAILGGIYTAESTLLTECVDPRDYSCRQLSSALTAGAGIVGTKTTCDRTGQTYPPVAVAGAASPTDGAPRPTSSSGASAWGPSSIVLWGSLSFLGCDMLLALIF